MRSLQLLLIVSVGVALVSSRAAVEEEKRLIKTSEEDPGAWMTEKEIFGLIQKGQHFMDVTDYNHPPIPPTKSHTNSIPSSPNYPLDVKELFGKINMSGVEDFVKQFSSYHNRYYNSQTGRASQLWLLSQVQEIVGSYPGATVQEVNHGYLQKSIVARIQGSDPTLMGEVVVFGAHLDSVNKRGSHLLAPGADDNGSGSAVGLETLRLLIQSRLELKRTVEFHWYAAEEIGLRGSQAIAEDYRGRINVVAMLNMDVVGYYVKDLNEISIYTDFADVELVMFLGMLTNDYLDFGFRTIYCGYGCSDHASWNRNGFPAVFAGEAIDHPMMHTEDDNFDNMNFDQLKEFIKLGISFMVEIAEPRRPLRP